MNISTQICFFFLLVSSIFLIWFVLQDWDQQESRYKKCTEMSKTQYQMLTSVIHSPRLCVEVKSYSCLIPDGWNLFLLPQVHGGGLHDWSGPLSGKTKCHYQHWNNRTRYCSCSLFDPTQNIHPKYLDMVTTAYFARARIHRNTDYHGAGSCYTA